MKISLNESGDYDEACLEWWQPHIFMFNMLSSTLNRRSARNCRVFGKSFFNVSLLYIYNRKALLEDSITNKRLKVLQQLTIDKRVGDKVKGCKNLIKLTEEIVRNGLPYEQHVLPMKHFQIRKI